LTAARPLAHDRSAVADVIHHPARRRTIMSCRHLSIAVALTLALAPTASAFDLTGTWTGTRKCKFFAAGEKTKTDRTGNVAITQDGNAIGFNTEIGSTHLYSGIANFSSEKPEKGELSVIHCRNHDMADPTPFNAFGIFKAKTKEGKVKATISGTTATADDDPNAPLHGTCKWKLTRIATANPMVPTFCGLVPSSRAAKQNVAYLDDAAVKRLHDDLLRYRLATYEYTLRGATPGSHLGVVIEDVAPSPAIAASGRHVDLYAYTSMAVAAFQTQAREIADLKAAVATLEATLARSTSPAATRRGNRPPDVTKR
jgi:hypothetical protein